MRLQNVVLQKYLLLFSCIFFALGLGLFAFTEEVAFVLPAFALLFVVFVIFDFKMAYWLLLILVPLSLHIEFAQNTFSLSMPSEPVMWLFYGSAMALIICYPRCLPKWFIFNTISLIILCQLIWLLVAVLFSEVPLLSAKFFISKTWYVVCFFVIPIWLVKEKRDFRTVFLCLLFPLVVYILIIIFRHSYYNFQFYFIDQAVGNLFYKHVDYASVMVLIFPFVLFANLLVRKSHKKIRLPLFVITLLFIFAIIFSYTRAAMGGIVFGLFVIVAIKWRLVNYILPVFFATVVGVLIYFSTDNKYLEYHPQYNQTYMHHEFGDHLKATMEGKDMSSMERVYRWIAAVRMAQDRPLTGFGPNSFYYFYKPYTQLSYKTYVSDNEEQTTTHNYFLYMLVEQGLPAMLLYTLLLVVVFAKTQSVYHALKDVYFKHICLAIAMSFACCFVINLFSELIETDKVGPIFYLLLSLLIIIEQKLSPADSQKSFGQMNQLKV